MKIKPLEVLKPTAILVIICVLITAAVAGTNELTKDKIAQQQALKAEESRKVVLPQAETFEEQTDVGDFTHYVGWAGDEAVGLVFETSAKGYGGDVKVMTGVDLAGAVTGVVILEHEETPGLGANAEKESFRDQYKGLQAAEGDIEVVRYQTPVGQQIEAMTGASITSRAVTAAVNQALEQYRQVMELNWAAEGGEE